MGRSASSPHRALLRILRAGGLPVAAAAILLSAFAAIAEEPDLSASIAERMKEILAFSRSGVVKIQSSDRHGKIEGTGFYADPSGTIYTVADVLGDGKNITVCQGVRKMPAHVLVIDPRTSLALIKVDAATPFLPIGDSSKLQVSMPIVAIGYPMDHPIWSSFGFVESFDKEYLHRFFHTTHIRANLAVQPGLGGAPVLNLKGEVVGMIVASVDGATGCFLLPINAAEKVRTDFANFGRLKPGWVGVTVEAVDSKDKKSCATRLSTLEPSSPAAEAGLREGDILLRVGDMAIHEPVDIFDASFYLTAGMDTSITVIRDGAERKFIVRAVENPYSVSAEELPASTKLTLEASSATPTPDR